MSNPEPSPTSASPSGSSALSKKGAETRQRILDTALEMFRERGFEQTTMRGIADAAGVSLGNAYYYFRSKEHLIQAFYGRTHVEHLNACAELLERETGLRERLAGVLIAKIESAAEYHRFAGILFKTAADPHSPLNPFSEESGPVREEAIELFAEVVRGAGIDVKGELGDELPELLWVYQMGTILFWIHDESPDCIRTRRLINRTVDIVVRLIHLANLPPLRPLVRSTLSLLHEIRSSDGESESSSHTGLRESRSVDEPRSER